MVPELVTSIVSIVCLVCGVWMLRASLRGQAHIVSRLAGMMSLVLTVHFGHEAYRGRSNAVAALALAAFALTMLTIGIAKKRFRAPLS